MSAVSPPVSPNPSSSDMIDDDSQSNRITVAIPNNNNNNSNNNNNNNNSNELSPQSIQSPTGTSIMSDNPSITVKTNYSHPNSPLRTGFNGPTTTTISAGTNSISSSSSASISVSPIYNYPPELFDRISRFRQDCLDTLYSNACHNLIPHSGKVVVFDSKLPVRHAFDGLLVHDLSCAPVWDSIRRKYVGMLSVSDFLDILLQTYNSEDKSLFLNISNQRISDWADYKKSRGTSINRLLCVSPESTLHEAVRQLLNYRVHRLCVVQLALADTVLRILTNHGILRFLRNNCKTLDTVTVRETGIGVFNNLLTVQYSTPLMRALEMLHSYKVSSIPIVNELGVPIDMYTRSDVRFLAMDNSWTHLDMTLEQALITHRTGRVLPKCTRDDTIATIAGLLVSSMKHSLICVHPDTGVIEGVVSLTDIFSFVLHSGPPKSESRIAALKAENTTDTSNHNNTNNNNTNTNPVTDNKSNKSTASTAATSTTVTGSVSQPATPSIYGRKGSGVDSAPLTSTSTTADGDIIVGMGDIDPEEDFLR